MASAKSHDGGDESAAILVLIQDVRMTTAADSAIAADTRTPTAMRASTLESRLVRRYEIRAAIKAHNHVEIKLT